MNTTSTATPTAASHDSYMNGLFHLIVPTLCAMDNNVSQLAPFQNNTINLRGGSKDLDGLQRCATLVQNTANDWDRDSPDGRASAPPYLLFALHRDLIPGIEALAALLPDEQAAQVPDTIRPSLTLLFEYLPKFRGALAPGVEAAAAAVGALPRSLVILVLYGKALESVSYLCDEAPETPDFQMMKLATCLRRAARAAMRAAQLFAALRALEAQDKGTVQVVGNLTGMGEIEVGEILEMSAELAARADQCNADSSIFYGVNRLASVLEANMEAERAMRRAKEGHALS